MIKFIKKSRFARYYLWNKTSRHIRKNNSGFRYYFKLFVIFPYIFIKYISFFKKIREPKSFKYNFAIIAIVKNEGKYIEEWIDYHKLIGFEKFYIYNNESSDNTESVLKKYIDDRTS